MWQTQVLYITPHGQILGGWVVFADVTRREPSFTKELGLRDSYTVSVVIMTTIDAICAILSTIVTYGGGTGAP